MKVSEIKVGVTYEGRRVPRKVVRLKGDYVHTITPGGTPERWSLAHFAAWAVRPVPAPRQAEEERG